MKAIIWMSEPLAWSLRERLSTTTTVVSSAREFAKTPRDSKTVSFVDTTTIAELDAAAAELGVSIAKMAPVIAICDGPLPTSIGWLTSYPWLAHVVGAGMLQHPMAVEHLSNVLSTLSNPGQPKLLEWLGPTVAGRRIRLAHSSKRAERLERMGEFFDSKGVGSRTIELLRDAAEELLTNAFYDAPVAAGAVKKPISRTQEVALPNESACDLVYGCREDLAIVRVRDPFGSLTRERLVEVLTRCARTDMQVMVDESMGGAGLGLWKIFTAASFVAISVVSHRHTEFLVGIGKRVSAAQRPFAFHLFFKAGAKRRFWQLLDSESSQPSVSNSITVVPKASST